MHFWASAAVCLWKEKTCTCSWCTPQKKETWLVTHGWRFAGIISDAHFSVALGSSQPWKRSGRDMNRCADVAFCSLSFVNQNLHHLHEFVRGTSMVTRGSLCARTRGGLRILLSTFLRRRFAR